MGGQSDSLTVRRCHHKLRAEKGIRTGLVPYRESHEGDVSEPLGLLAKHSLLGLSGLYK